VNATPTLSALIAAPDGHLGNALCTVVKTIPGLHVVGRSASQVETLRDLAYYDPDLLLLDVDLNRSAGNTALALVPFLTLVRDLVPKIRVITLVDDLRQKQLAWGAGVDQVILKSGYDQPLRQAVEFVSAGSFRDLVASGVD